LPFEEFSSLVAGGDVGSESVMVEVDLIGIVAKELTGVEPEVAFLVFEIVAEGTTRVVLEVMALVVVRTVGEESTRAVVEAAALVVVGVVVGAAAGVMVEVAALVVGGIVVGKLTRVVPKAEVPGVVGASVAIDVDTGPTIFRQG